MSESCLFQLQQYFNTNPYRDYGMNRPHVPISARSNRVNKSSSNAFHQLINNDKNPLILDRFTYKLHIKSNLNVDTLRETHSRGHLHTNSPINEPLNLLPSRSTTTTKMFNRQSTARTRTTNSRKTNDLDGIEGNAVHVGTINDLIKQFHREQIRLDNYSNEYLDNISNERLPAFLSERTLKQPQALTEYHLNIPASPCKRSPTNRYYLKDKRNINTNQYSLKRRSTSLISHHKRIQDSQSYICNKLTITDPYNSEANQSKLPSTQYIFPAIRPLGYFTRKSIENLSATKKKHSTNKQLKNSLESLDQFSTDRDDSSLSIKDTNNSRATFTDLYDNLQTPPNTKINVDLLL